VVGDHHVDFPHTESRFADEGTAPVVGSVDEIHSGEEIVAAEVVDIDSVLQVDFDSDVMVDAEAGEDSHSVLEK
jgi:hypothetical protein